VVFSLPSPNTAWGYSIYIRIRMTDPAREIGKGPQDPNSGPLAALQQSTLWATSGLKPPSVGLGNWSKFPITSGQRDVAMS
jgi:hypothetical protein